MSNLISANLDFTYDKDNFSQADFWGLYLFLGFREFPLRRATDRTLLSGQTYTQVNQFTNISFDLFSATDILDNQGIKNLESRHFYFNDEDLTEDNFRVGSIYLRSEIIFNGIGSNIRLGVIIKDLTLSANFLDNSSDTIKSVVYSPIVKQDYKFNYLNGAKVYLNHVIG